MIFNKLFKHKFSKVEGIFEKHNLIRCTLIRPGMFIDNYQFSVAQVIPHKEDIYMTVMFQDGKFKVLNQLDFIRKTDDNVENLF